MKKSAGMKRLTVIILLIAAVSLVFGSFIMLLGSGNENQIPNSESTVEIVAE